MIKWKKYSIKVGNKLVNGLFYACLVFLLLIVFHLFCITSFKIPSDSMEPALIAGDRIMVDKLSFGARFFNIDAALKRKHIDIYRMPGWDKIERNDVIVFNFPYQAHWDSICFDVMKYYVKRCIALPGDTLEIRNGFFKIRGVDQALGNRDTQVRMSFLPDSTDRGVVMNSFPWNEELNWTIKEFGPLPVPMEGQEVELNHTTWLLYRQLIGWEQKKRVKYENGKIMLGDSIIRQYRFEENYYFVSGDKAENSKDSRYWGMLPETFIVGKALRVWNSVDPYAKRIRWERIFKRIE